MESPLEVADKQKGDKKKAVAFLDRRAMELSQSMAGHWTAGHYILAAHDAKQLAAVLDVLGQVDVNS